jgi:hypothetical protein
VTTDLGVEPGTDADVATGASHSRSWERRAMANAREAARPQPPGELDGPVARTPAAEYAERHGVDITSVEGAKAEARRRGAARKSSHR